MLASAHGRGVREDHRADLEPLYRHTGCPGRLGLSTLGFGAPTGDGSQPVGDTANWPGSKLDSWTRAEAADNFRLWMWQAARHNAYEPDESG